MRYDYVSRGARQGGMLASYSICRNPAGRFLLSLYRLDGTGFTAEGGKVWIDALTGLLEIDVEAGTVNGEEFPR